MGDYAKGTKRVWQALDAAAPRVAGKFEGLVRSIVVLVQSADEAEVIVFIYSDSQLEDCADAKLGEGIVELLKQEAHGQEATLGRLQFKVEFDSHERVLRDFDGSYFHRLR